MRILITGSKGFVGTNLLNKIKDNSDIVLFTPSSSELNLMKYDDVDKYLKDNNIDTVIHLAMKFGDISTATNKQRQLLEDNLLLNYNIVKVSLNNSIKKFITFGSSSSYGSVSSPTDLLKEDYLWKDKPENTYGTTKLILLEHLQSQNDMNWVYLLLPNPYGPNDHFFEKGAHFIPATFMKIENALKNNLDYIEVWGDGSQIRDFLYVDDVIDALNDSVFTDKYDRTPLNLSTSNGNTIKRATELICEYMKEELDIPSIEIRYDLSKPTGAMGKIMSNEKIKEVNKNIKFTSFEDGLKKTVTWYKEFRKNKIG